MITLRGVASSPFGNYEFMYRGDAGPLSSLPATGLPENNQ